jgi:transcriptional regulator with XRE-family HTH domain
MKQVLENIKKFRELKNYTREHVAIELDMSSSGYSKLERGEVELTVSKLFRLAEILEVSVPQILNFDASKIFNVTNNNVVNGVDVTEQNISSDIYKDKYIEMLEKEVDRLRGSVSSENSEEKSN